METTREKNIKEVPLKRILFLTQALTPSGSTSYLSDLSETLVQRGCECLALTGSGNVAAFNRPNIKAQVVSGLYGLFQRFFAWKRAAKIARAFQPTVIHAQHIESVPLANYLQRVLNCPVVLSLHHFIGRHHLAKYVDYRVIAVSEALREHLVNQTGIPKEMIRVAQDGVDMKRYRLTPVRDFHVFRPVIGVAGKLVAQKGQEVFLRAAKIMLDSGLDAEFVVAGVGDDLNRLRKIAKELDLLTKVTFTAGSPPDRDCIEVFDILVHTSYEEGLGLHVIEGMAMGKPVVATGSGGIFTLVKDGETGLLVPPKNPQAIADKVLYLIGNPVLRREIALAGRELVARDFSLDRMADQINLLYQEAVLDYAPNQTNVR